ncbi:MAG: DUF4252 domain-containing protein [bacterium]|nr:DUF4252 domain-containing protein [bacterium]
MSRACQAGLGVVLVLLSSLSTSCVLRGPSGIKNEVADATGAEYDRQFGLTLGRVSMAIARWGIRIAEDDEGDSDIPISLKGVKGVQVGVYRVKDDSWGDEPESIDPASLGEWEPIVAIREENENVFVLVRTRDERIKRMLVLVSDPDELVIVRLKGKLDQVIQEALHFGLEEAGREDLYEPALEQMEQNQDPEAV